MKLAVCPACRVIHEAVGPAALNGVSEQRAYDITHCNLCETPSEKFRQLPDQPDLTPGEFGYPKAVVPWIDEGAAALTKAPPARRTADPKCGEPRGAATARTRSSAGLSTSESNRHRAVRQLLGGTKLFKRPVRSRLEVHSAIVKGIPFACLLALLDGFEKLDADVLAVLGADANMLQRWRQAPAALMPVDLASRTWLLAETLVIATEMTGGRNEANDWLSQGADGLDGRRPVELLRTIQGAALVSDFLRRP